MQVTGAEVAAAFMQQNDKKTWKARAVNRQRANGQTDVVHFESTGGMVSLMYHVEAQQFAVKFNKFHGAWGDYIKAIARSLFVVLNTLKSAGLPFDAPPTLAGMVIEAVTTEDTTTYVRWPGQPVDNSPAGYLQQLRGEMSSEDRAAWLKGEWAQPQCTCGESKEPCPVHEAAPGLPPVL